MTNKDCRKVFVEDRCSTHFWLLDSLFHAHYLLLQSMETTVTAAYSIVLSAWKIQTENLSCNLNVSHHDHHWATSCDYGLSPFFGRNMQVHVSSVCAVWILTILVYVRQQCYWTACTTTNPAWAYRDSTAKLNHVTAVSSISVHCWKETHTPSHWNKVVCLST